jgi:cysteine-rich repeat protein
LTSRTKQIACFIALALSFPAACSNSDGRTEVGPQTTGGAGTGGAPILGAGGTGSTVGLGTGGDGSSEAPTINCADGHLDKDEACDDGNKEDGDGCHANCRALEKGFVCPQPGEACQPIARCGDGAVIFPEQCDDGALEPGDGCSATCKVEIGFKCDASPSTCTATVCGDGAQEGAETCDDGNATPLDGCNERCQAEPNCTAEGCTSACGDGLVLGEEQCDDGNVLSGDGCSDTCQSEDGYTCVQGQPCDASDPSCILTIPALFRDFDNTSDTDDFQVSCGQHVTA